MSLEKLRTDNRDRILRKISELIDKHKVDSNELKEFRSRYVSHAEQMLRHRNVQLSEVRHLENLAKARAAKALKQQGGKV
jgi:hypothetical protein